MGKSQEGMSRTEEFGAQTRGQTFVYDPDDLVLVTDTMHPLYDPSVNDPPPEDMVTGMVELGVLEPILIRKNGKDPKTGKAIVEVVDGRMRVKAARLANKERRKLGQDIILIDAKLATMRDDKAESAMIAANEHKCVRSVLVRAEMLERYLAHGHTDKQAKVYFGINGREYRKVYDVMGMSDALKSALGSKKITLEVARELASLPESKQEAALAATLAEAGAGRGRKAKDAAARQTGNSNGPAFRCKTPKMVLKAIDTSSCMPRSDYQRGVLDALEWIIGRKDAAWAGEAEPSKK